MREKTTSFFRALVSKDAREQRRQEIQQERERRKKIYARWEASALSWFWFLATISVFQYNFALGILALLGSCAWWTLVYLISYNHGPIIKGGNEFPKEQGINCLFRTKRRQIQNEFKWEAKNLFLTLRNFQQILYPTIQHRQNLPRKI